MFGEAKLITMSEANLITMQAGLATKSDPKDWVEGYKQSLKLNPPEVDEVCLWQMKSLRGNDEVRVELG